MARTKAEVELESFPDRVGRYRLIAPIGRGGLATVYYGLAEGARGFRRSVAIKLLHPHLREETELLAHLFNEAKLVSRIRHPNVVEVIDVGEDARGAYLVLEYIEGETLAGLIRHAGRERIPTSIALRILGDSMDGLHAAHELAEGDRPLGLVHRDFSPQNIIIGVDGVTRLIDFGVAKAASASIQTRTGLVKGKVGYMSPEQARGHDVDRRTDVWAAGVVTWEVFAGRRLFKADGDLASMLQIITTDPPPLEQIRPDVPAAVVEAVRAALTRERRKRCSTASELHKLLLGQPQAPIASSAEVGEYVRRVAGQALEERRARIAKFERLRAEMRELAGVGLPRAVDSTPTIQTDPVDTDTGQSIPEGTPATPPARRIAAALVVLFVAASATAVGLWQVRRSAQPTNPAIPTPASAGSGQPTSPSPSARPSALAEAQPKVLRISANAPIAQLKISGRKVEIDVPATRIDVPAPEGGFSIEAVSNDGRRSTFVTLVPAQEAALAFSARIERSPRVRPGPSPSAGPSGLLPLSPSPYGKR